VAGISLSLRSLLRVLCLATLTAAAWLVLGSAEARAADGLTGAAPAPVASAASVVTEKATAPALGSESATAARTALRAATAQVRVPAAGQMRPAGGREVAAQVPAAPARAAVTHEVAARPAAAAGADAPTRPVAKVAPAREVAPAVQEAAEATVQPSGAAQALLPLAVSSGVSLPALPGSDVVDLVTTELHSARVAAQGIVGATAISVPLPSGLVPVGAVRPSAASPAGQIGPAVSAASAGAVQGHALDYGSSWAASTDAVAPPLSQLRAVTERPRGPGSEVPAQAPAPLGGSGSGSSTDLAAMGRPLDMKLQAAGSGLPADDHVPSADNGRPDTSPD
jgi:hypothetical protein